MKAKIKKSGIILSIGMIVKNEEKNLEGCLESLRPLMDAVPSELIIVDTGSTDATVEIAQRYTDIIYHFEWINDFSAARNYGVDRAKGLWFLQVDADDRLQDPAEMIEFLNNEKENSKYYTANILYHSYTNKEHSEFSDAKIVRLFRLGIGNRFYGTIHETPKRVVPTKDLPTVFDHYGYIYETPEDAQKKRDRNNVLLEKELEADPDDIRLIDHYVATCPLEKRGELLEHGRELCKKNPGHFYFSNIYWKLSRYYLAQHKLDDAIALAEEYFSLTTQDHVGDIEIRFNVGNAYFQQKKYARAAQEFEAYLDLCSRYLDGSLQQQDNMVAVTERVSVQNRLQILCQLAYCQNDGKEYGKALKTIMTIHFSDISSKLLPALQQMIQISIEKTEDYAALFELEGWMDSEQADKPQKKSMAEFLSSLCLEARAVGHWEVLEQSAAGMGTPMGRAVLAASESAPEGLWGSTAKEFSEGWEHLEGYSSLLLAAGMRYSRNILSLLYRVGRDYFKQAALCISEKVSDILDVVTNYQPSRTEKEDLLWRGWMVEMDLQVFRKAEDENKIPILKQLIQDFSWYVNHLYNVNLLCPEKVAVLPSAHRFGYWAGLALDAEKAGNEKGYIHYLGEAARSCPEMADAVKLLLKDFQENDEEFQRQKEQKELAEKIKGIIEGMILNGRTEDAKAVLAQYELIAPDDPDILPLKTSLLQQPSPAEM